MPTVIRFNKKRYLASGVNLNELFDQIPEPIAYFDSDNRLGACNLSFRDNFPIVVEADFLKRASSGPVSGQSAISYDALSRLARNELTDARANRERLAALENRDRIARDLHDHVIQRLFAAGLTAQSLAETTTEPLIQEGLARTIGDLNATIRQIRTTIFGLTDNAVTATSLRRSVASIVDQMTQTLGFRPEVNLSGPLDTMADDAMVGDVEAVLRESLTNVSRHAGATAVVVQVAAGASALTISISDDGVGMGEMSRRSGLANLRSRAEARGGHLTIGEGDEKGLRLQWAIPIR